MYIGELFEIILESLWFMLPAYAATIIPLYVKKIKILSMPINKKLFGKNKTYRGFLFGILIAMFTIYLQNIFYIKYFVIRALSIIYYDRTNYLLIGFLMGFGALFGDLAKSFFKRKKGIKEGKQWFPFDNLDYVIGTLIFVSIIFIPSIEYLIAIIILSPLLHYIISKLAIKLSLR